MLQFVLSAVVGLSGLAAAKGAPPTDAAVLAALPPSDAPRTDVTIVKSLLSARAGGPAALGRWACTVYYAEGSPPRQRVHIVYLESAPGK